MQCKRSFLASRNAPEPLRCEATACASASTDSTSSVLRALTSRRDGSLPRNHGHELAREPEVRERQACPVRWHPDSLARMTLSAKLLEILACPEDKGPLYFIADEDVLYNPRLTRRYDVKQGIPIMLIDEATTVDAAEHERVMAKIAAAGISPTFEA